MKDLSLYIQAASKFEEYQTLGNINFYPLKTFNSEQSPSRVFQAQDEYLRFLFAELPTNEEFAFINVETKTIGFRADDFAISFTFNEGKPELKSFDDLNDDEPASLTGIRMELQRLLALTHSR